MTVMIDTEIQQSIAVLVRDLDNEFVGTSQSPIKGASLDLSVGFIYVPGTKKDELGGLENPLTELSLLQGHTAVIMTKETLSLPPNIAAIAFPPARVSQAGLLTTNPGHVDPGYSGALHLTVINMGCEPFNLKAGDRIIRLILFRLTYTPARSAPRSPGISQQLLSRLSRDFLNVDARAARAAQTEVREANIVQDIRTTQATLWTSVASGVVALIVAAATLYTTSATRDAELRKEIAEIKSQVARLDERTNRAESPSSILERLTRLESLLRTPSGPNPGPAPSNVRPQ